MTYPTPGGWDAIRSASHHIMNTVEYVGTLWDELYYLQIRGEKIDRALSFIQKVREQMALLEKDFSAYAQSNSPAPEAIP